MIIGLIGKVGSGKTACAEYIRDNYGAILFSCDEVAKEMIKKREIEIDVNADSFFSDSDMQDKIRKEIHPRVFLRIYENIYYLLEHKTNENRIFVIETALPCDEFIKSCNKVIYIENSYENKVNILKTKRNYDEEKTKKVLAAQKYYEKFYVKADYKIYNNSTKDDLFLKVREVMDEICIACK